jgi:transcriptional regulator with XRE-family HTH domain
MAISLKATRLSHDPPLRLIDVAHLAGVSVSLVSMVESGYASTEESRAAIAQAVGASYGSFWPPAPDGVRAITRQVEP